MNNSSSMTFALCCSLEEEAGSVGLGGGGTGGGVLLAEAFSLLSKKAHESFVHAQ